MKYRTDRYGNKISQLGYGCMRFTRKGSAIDYEKAEREVLLAIEEGVNYFDTAYIYPGSEECLGRILDEILCAPWRRWKRHLTRNLQGSGQTTSTII